MQRKVIGYIVFIAVIISITGCETQVNEDTQLMNMVEKMEKYDHLLLNFKITYDEYKRETDPMLAKGFTNKENKLVFGINDKKYTGKDLVKVSLDEMKKFKEEFAGMYNKYSFDKLEISQSYYFDTMKWKQVFVRKTGDYDGKEFYIYKKYMFRHEENRWKVIGIDNGFSLKDRRDESIIKSYEYYDGEPINYVKELDLKEFK